MSKPTKKEIEDAVHYACSQITVQAVGDGMACYGGPLGDVEKVQGEERVRKTVQRKRVDMVFEALDVQTRWKKGIEVKQLTKAGCSLETAICHVLEVS